MKLDVKWSLVLSAMLFICSADAAEQKVSSADEVERAAAQAKPGDVLVMSDGDWKDQVIHFKANGTNEAPITLRAQTPGKVRLIGKSSIVVEGDDLVVSGVSLDHSKGEGDGIVIHGDRN